MTKTVDQWAAEQCGVTMYIGKRVYDHEPYWFDNIRDYNFEWTIKDPRCCEIVREKLKINTSWIAEDKWRAVENKWRSDESCCIAKEGKNPAEAELACITAIYEASQ